MKLHVVILVVAACRLAGSKHIKKADTDRFVRQVPSAKFEVTLPIYSSVPNPVWLVGSDNSNYARINTLFNTARSSGKLFARGRLPSVLGYKGFLVQKTDETTPFLILSSATKDLEKLLLTTAPQDAMTSADRTAFTAVIDAGTVTPAPATPTSSSQKRACFSRLRNNNQKGPSFEFNDATKTFWSSCDRQYGNCYNYANNVFNPDGDAVPGKRPVPKTGGGNFGDLIKQRSIEDGLKEIQTQGNAMPDIPSSTKKNIVALFVTPDGKRRDMHWYRRDRNTGNWSHKPGWAEVTDKDAAGNIITDPRTAAQGPNNYQFVCFMETNIDKVAKKIGTICVTKCV